MNLSEEKRALGPEERFAFGGFLFGIQLPKDAGPEVVPEPCRRFRGEGTPEVFVRFLEPRLSLPGSLGPRLFDARPNWRLYRQPTGHLIRTMDCDARISGEFHKIDIHPRPGDNALVLTQILSYPLPELLMIHLLADNEGMLLHACGVREVNGEVTLFCGASGHGKSTMAGLWARKTGAIILCDDRIVVRREGSDFLAFGTPWHGTGGYASPASGPVRRIFLLEHGTQNRISPLLPAEAVAGLVRASFPPFWDSPRMEATLAFAVKLVENILVSTLAFVPDSRVVKWLKDK